VPGVAEAVALGPHDTAWVALQAGRVVPIDLRDRKVGRTIRVGGHPSAIVIAAR
jgi:hypothetical protein